MHTIEPFYRWENYYISENDPCSPFYGEEKVVTQYQNTIYGYYIHPMWDHIGSDTLYLRILYASYTRNYCIIELIGEWNDTLHNDIAILKRNIVDHLLDQGIKHFILIGENVLNFHGSDDCYYEEWFEDIEDGWIAGLNFQEHVSQEMANYNIDWYINLKGELDVQNWRTLKPQLLFDKVESLIARRLSC